MVMFVNGRVVLTCESVDEILWSRTFRWSHSLCRTRLAVSDFEFVEILKCDNSK